MTADQEIVDVCEKKLQPTTRARVMVPYPIWVKYGQDLICPTRPPLITSIMD